MSTKTKTKTNAAPRAIAPLSFIHFGRETCGTVSEAERREWWLSNGRGAYAAGTIAHTLTRRYHGLLVAPTQPPLGRHLVFAKADAILVDDKQEWPLFTNRWAGGAVAPAGHVHIESFHLDGRMPVWRFAIGDIAIEQRIWMEHGRDATRVAWRLLGDPGRPLSLRVSLLANGRDHHHVAAAGSLAFEVGGDGDGLIVTQAQGIVLRIYPHGGRIETDQAWTERFDLPEERARGLEDQDNHIRVGILHIPLQPDAWCGVSASLDDVPLDDLALSMARAAQRDAALLRQAQSACPELGDAPDWIKQLVLAADGFLFARPLPGVPDGESVIAGYPWFGDWGRDTMIALPGLTLATGRYDSARRILTTFARFVDGGMLPNVFPGAGETPDYNTVDAALWYIDAWRAYIEATSDIATLAAIWPTLVNIINAHLSGTRYDIGMDAHDGLLYAGEAGVQLTWMDAKVGDWVVTPRIGKPVEINALWYNALCIMADFSVRLKEDPQRYRNLAGTAKDSFQRYRRADGQGLMDVLDAPDGDDGNGDDDSLRPNQIFAVSLAHSPLDPEAQAEVLAICARELLSSYGLRSLGASHPDYRPRYDGGVWERDGSYHQGTVWAWLLGHYAIAEYRVTGDAARAISRLEPMADHLRDAGLGTISEIFDAEPPHMPRGAPSQAWSVACILEAWWRINQMNDKPFIAGKSISNRPKMPHS